MLKHYEGLCHVFIDKDADLKKAIEISVNAKTYRYGICGTMETLLTSEEVAAKVLPEIKAELDKLGVELRGCEKQKKLLMLNLLQMQIGLRSILPQFFL